jgi:transcriptional regulator
LYSTVVPDSPIHEPRNPPIVLIDSEYAFEQYVVMQYVKSRMLDRELKKGSAELLILSLVEDQPRHGYDLSKLIETRSDGVLKFRVASLYPLLYRLEKRGWIHGRWIEKAGQRRRRYYRLTPAGARVLASQRSTWKEFAAAINRIAGVEHA